MVVKRLKFGRLSLRCVAVSERGRRMSVTSLYVSACRVAVRGAPGLQELRALLPLIRNLVGCQSCGKLEGGTAAAACEGESCMCRPESPEDTKEPVPEPERKRRDAEREHRSLYAAAYTQLCAYVAQTDAFKRLADRKDADSDPDTLVELVREAVEITEGRHSPLSRARASLYCDTATQTAEPSPSSAPILKPLANGSSYSVMYAGSGNKLTFKRKPPDDIDQFPKESRLIDDVPSVPNNFKKPTYRSRNSNTKRKGCRCGNATATPGKLTCCGQRCPCYVDSKPCTECKCKGCRNPHRADGQKVRPHIPQLDNIQISMPIKREKSPIRSDSMEDPDMDAFEPSTVERAMTFDSSDIKTSNIKLYTSQLQEVTSDLAPTLMMGEDVSLSSPTSEDSGSPRTGLTSTHSLLVPVHNILIPFHRQATNMSHQDSTSDIEVEV